MAEGGLLHVLVSDHTFHLGNLDMAITTYKKLKKKNQSLRAILHFLNHQVQEFNKNFPRKSEHIQTLSIAIKIIVIYDLKK